MTGILAVEAMCWGDVGLMLSIPGSGLGNAAVMAVGTPEQKEKYGKLYCAMAITEPGAGSDSAAVSTTAELDGDEWVLNGDLLHCWPALRRGGGLGDSGQVPGQGGDQILYRPP